MLTWPCYLVLHLVCYQVPMLLQRATPAFYNKTKPVCLSNILCTTPPPLTIANLPGYMLLKDASLLMALREVVLMLKVSYAAFPASIPALNIRLPKQASKQEQISFLFKVLFFFVIIIFFFSFFCY